MKHNWLLYPSRWKQIETGTQYLFYDHTTGSFLIVKMPSLTKVREQLYFTNSKAVRYEIFEHQTFRTAK